MHLALRRAVLLVDLVEIAARDGGGEPLGHVVEAALRDVDDLVVVRLTLDRTRQQFNRRAPVDRERVDQRLERKPLRRPQPAKLTRPLLELEPGRLDVVPQRGQEHVDETGRGPDEVLASLLGDQYKPGRSCAHHLERLAAALHGIDAARERAQKLDGGGAVRLSPGTHCILKMSRGGLPGPRGGSTGLRSMARCPTRARWEPGRWGG